MNEDRETIAPNQPSEAFPPSTNERVFFRVNEAAYGQHLGLVHWNDPDRWYHGNGADNAEHGAD